MLMVKERRSAFRAIEGWVRSVLPALPMSQMGHFRKSAVVSARSALPPTTDIERPMRHVRLVPGRDLYTAAIYSLRFDAGPHVDECGRITFDASADQASGTLRVPIFV